MSLTSQVKWYGWWLVGLTFWSAAIMYCEVDWARRTKAEDRQKIEDVSAQIALMQSEYENKTEKQIAGFIADTIMPSCLAGRKH